MKGVEKVEIDIYAYNSKLKHINPQFKVWYALITLFLCVLLDNIYVSLAVIFSMAYITISKGGIHVKDYMSLLKIPVEFMILGSVAIALSISRNPGSQYNLNVHFFYIYASNESIYNALKVMLKALGAVSAMYMMILSTNTSEIISVMKKSHVPKIVIELMNMIYRFIFILLDVHCRMRNSAQSRLGYIDFRTSCYSFGSTASNLLIVSLKKANAYYDAMEARCYDGEMNFLEEEKKVEIKHIVWSCLYICILIAVWYMTI